MFGAASLSTSARTDRPLICRPASFKVALHELSYGPGDLHAAITLIVADATSRLSPMPRLSAFRAAGGFGSH